MHPRGARMGGLNHALGNIFADIYLTSVHF